MEETEEGVDLSLRLKRAAKRRILGGGRGSVQRISQAMGWDEGGEIVEVQRKGGEKGFTERVEYRIMRVEETSCRESASFPATAALTPTLTGKNEN